MPGRDAIPPRVIRPLSWLRPRVRVLAALALLALVTPSFVDRSAADRGAADAFTLVICTVDGLVTLDADGGAPDAPPHRHAGPDCAACLGRDLGLPPPDAAQGKAPPVVAQVLPSVLCAAPPQTPPHLHPAARAPPALA
jgi:hypothetical protein